MCCWFRRRFAIAGLLIVLASCGPDVKETTSLNARGIDIGQAPPTFRSELLNGNGTFRLSDVNSERVVVTFFASWCLPCIEETKILREHYEVTGRSEFEVVGIVFDDALSDAKRFAKDHDIPWPLVRDDDGSIAKRYGIRGIPVAIFLDAEQRVTTQVFGLTQRERLLDALAVRNDPAP